MADTVKIPVHYVKSNAFRVVHADGAYGGATAHGFIQMAFYSERVAYPRETILEISPDGVQLGETDVERRQGAVREIEVAAIMDLKTAESLHQWLGQKVDELRKLLAQAQANG
jgi:hypothetical protein